MSIDSTDSFDSEDVLIIDESGNSPNHSESSSHLIVAVDQDGNSSEPEIEENNDQDNVTTSYQGIGETSLQQTVQKSKNADLFQKLESKKIDSNKFGRKFLEAIQNKRMIHNKSSTEQKDEESYGTTMQDSEGEDVGKIRIRNFDEIKRTQVVYRPEEVVTIIVDKPAPGMVKLKDAAATEPITNSITKSVVEPVIVTTDIRETEASGGVKSVPAKKVVASVAKKSGSGIRKLEKKKRKYLSESDDPVSPSPVTPRKKKVKKRRSSTAVATSSSDSEEENIAGEKSVKRSGGSASSKTDFELDDHSTACVFSDEEDNEPLIVRIRREAEERGIKKEMPKPPIIPKKKRRVSPVFFRKKSKFDSDSDDEKKYKNLPSEPTLKQSNPHWSPEVTEAVKTMLDEVKSSNPNFDVLKKGMKISFAYRKHAYQQGSDVEKTLKVFPALSDYRLLKRDFEKFRKTEFKTLEKKLEDGLMMEYERYFRNNYLSPDPVIASAKEQCKLNIDNTALVRDIQMLCLGASKSKGKLNGALYKQRSKGDSPFKGVTPTIDIRNALGSKNCKISVYCEGTKFTEVPNFFEAVLCVYGIYWIFNMCYQRVHRPFFEFFDSLIGE